MIFTFYSYKGGVGRTMALANIAELFYQAGLKVLMVDWDLEAPGVERFFQNALDPDEILDRPGIVDMLLEYKRQMAQPRSSAESKEETSPFETLEQFLTPVYPPTPGKGELWLLPTGRRSEENFSKYANAVLTFDWTDFYQNWEGERYFEWLRQQFNNIADVVLIDSRTGVTEMGGVCTYHLADTVVMFCAPNQQNLSGTYKMTQKYRAPEVQSSRGGRPLNVLIIPARIERAESELLDEFQKNFTDLFESFVPEITDLQELWQLSIPYVPKYAFTEAVAVRDTGRASAEDMALAFRNLYEVMVRLVPESLFKKIFSQPSTPTYNLKNIRTLLIEAFTDEELRRLCYDVPDLKPVYDQLVQVTGKVGVVDRIIDYAERRLQLETLLTLAKENNPTRYEIHQPYYSSVQVAQKVTLSEKVEVTPQALRKAYLSLLFENSRGLSIVDINPKVASTKTDIHLYLDAVYVPLLTLSSETDKRLTQSETLNRGSELISALVQLNHYPRLVLLGAPGSGKSTFVNFVAMCLAGEVLGQKRANLAWLNASLSNNDDDQHGITSHSWTHGPLLPVRVILRDFAARGLPSIGQKATAKDLWNFIAAELEVMALSDYVPHLRQELLEQGGLLLLDGLDEVPETNQRRLQIKQAIEDFSAVFRRCRVLITSRSYAYQQQEWRLSGFTEVSLAPFSYEQIQHFVNRWYAFLAELQGLHPDNAQGRAELLKQAIYNNDRLRMLAERPQLLTLIVSLHAWRGGNLPEKREELYADILDLLLDRWESPKTVRNVQGQIVVLQPSLAEWLKVDPNEVRRLLDQLAYEAHASQPELVGTADINEGELVSGLIRLSRNPEINPVRLVEYLSQRAGLLLPRGVGIYAFPHRTFQEYLAACYLTDYDYPDQIAELARTDPHRWGEVAMLAGAKAARGSTAAIWQLVEALSYREPGTTSDSNLADVWGAQLAGQVLVETANLKQISEKNWSKVERIRRWLMMILLKSEIPAIERVATGVILARLGDLRPGIGLRPDGLPDISWCDVPAGPFFMDTDSSQDPDTHNNILPQHRIELPSFRISRYPITNAQYASFVAAGGYQNIRYWSVATNVFPSKVIKDEWADQFYNLDRPFNLPNHPVVGVNRFEVVAFCAWLTEQLSNTGELNNHEIITLPTEAQWEKASRGADSRTYPWGNETNSDRANFSNTGVGTTSAVGCFPGGASPYGCEDMSGNVWEWTQSLYQPYPYAQVNEREDLNETSNSVIRGGSYQDGLDMISCSARRQCPPDYKSLNVGFRVVVVTI